MKRMFLILVLAGSLVGCSTKQAVIPNASSAIFQAIDYRQLNSELKGSKATLVLVNGDRVEVGDVRLGADTTFFSDWSHHPVKRIPTAEILKLQTGSTGEKRTMNLSRINDPGLDFQRISEVLGNTRALIILSNGDKYDAEEIRLGRDTTTFADRSQSLPGLVPTRDVAKIETLNHGQGAFDGLFFGLVGGGLFGYGLAESLSSDFSSESSSSRSLGILVVTAGSAILGTVGGVTYGAVRGHTTEYTIIHQLPNR